MAKIHHIGDWAVMLGPCFAETPFNYAMKGTDISDPAPHWGCNFVCREGYQRFRSQALAWLLAGGGAFK